MYTNKVIYRDPEKYSYVYRAADKYTLTMWHEFFELHLFSLFIIYFLLLLLLLYFDIIY